MIVVIGQPAYSETEAGPVAGGLAAQIALAAAGQGRTVQLVGKVGEDDEGESVVLALARSGVGHVAMLREAGRRTPHIAPSTGDPTALDEMPAGGVAVDTAPAPPAVSRDGPALDAADVDLALRYLTDFGVVVLADRADHEMAGVMAAAAGWADARLIVVVPAGDAEPGGLPADAIVFEAPSTDPDSVFAAMVGAFAAALDDGGDPAVAFRTSLDATGWTPAPGE